jgi:4-aminobutyrate---pyruvate transaminase
VTLIAHSVHARDIAHFIHPQTDLVQHEREGSFVISHGKGIYVYDESGFEYLEGAAGLWCAAPRLFERAACQGRL